MTDTISEERRSWNMSRIKAENTNPERLVRSLLHRMGYRFRIHRKDLPGRPDIVLPKYNTVIFVHGCFWHRHKGCKRATMPKSRVGYWENKFFKNVERDKENKKKLKKIGWKVLVIWECEINNNIDKIKEKIQKNLQN